MEPHIKKIVFALLVIITSLSMACKKSDDGGLKDTYAYVSPGSSSYNVLSGSNISLVRNTVLSSTYSAFPVLLTRPFSHDVQITAKIDTGLVRIYDSIYNDVTSLRPPDGAFMLSNNGKVTIKAGQISSQDSLKVVLSDVSKIPAATNTYIIPVVLNATDNGIPLSDTRQIMYVKVSVTSVQAGIRSLNNTNVVDVILNNINGVNTGTNTIYLRGVLNKAISQKVTVTVKNNNELINAYNTANGTNYLAFPTGSFQLSKPNATIPENATISADSITVMLTDLNAFTTSGKNYILPVQVVDDANASSPVIDTTKNIVYVRVNVSINNIDPANSGLTGTTISRTTWNVTSSSSYSTTYSVAKLIYGQNATAWISNGILPAWVQLDMGSSNTVKGFSIIPCYAYIPGDFIVMQVLSSSNGTTWNLEGTYRGTPTNASSTSTKPDTKTVKFVNPVTARYFKFNIINATSGDLTGIGELNALK